jgi:D-alanyl-D-alanine carboxypeptidase
MAQAGRALLGDAELTAISTTPAYMPAWDGPLLKNGNKLPRLYPGAYGVKIGFTELAGQTIVAAAEREGRQLVVAVLGSKDRYSDAAALFDWAFASTVRLCQS